MARNIRKNVTKIHLISQPNCSKSSQTAYFSVEANLGLSTHPHNFDTKKDNSSNVGARLLRDMRPTRLPIFLQINIPNSLHQCHSVVLPKAA